MACYSDGEMVAMVLTHEGNELAGIAKSIVNGQPFAVAIGRRVASEYHKTAYSRLSSVGEDGLSHISCKVGAGEMHLNVESTYSFCCDKSFERALAGSESPSYVHEKRRRLR